MDTLGDALPREMERVTKLMEHYRHPALQGAGAFALALMQADLARATKALAEGDVAAMIVAHKSLSEYEG